MRILKIRFENIHSLKGEHEIDFGEGILAEAGLFAITGPTGSGKSTLLDIITLALYNRIARVDKAISNTILEDDGGVMTRNMTSCYAEVSYRVNGKDYRSHWSIERNRNNNLNSRKQEIVEMTTNTILSSGTRSPEQNAKIIGLSYEQFIKAIVLSQGEFSKLLQAPRNERNKLLEDITGARSYREIGRAVYHRYSKIKDVIKLKEASLDAFALLTPEVIEEKTKELHHLNHERPKAEKAFSLASDRLKIRKQLKEKLAGLEKLAENKKVLSDRQKSFKARKVKLLQHDKFSRYSPIIQEFDHNQKEKHNTDKQIDQLKTALQQAAEKQELRLATASKLTKAEFKTMDEALETLEGFRKKVAALVADEHSKEREAQLLQKQIQEGCNKITALGYPLAKTDDLNFKDDWQSLERHLSDEIARSGLSSLEELENSLSRLSSNSQLAMELLSKKEQNERLNGEVKRLRKEQTDTLLSIDKAKKTTEALEAEINELRKEIKNQAEQLNHQRRHQSLDDHRAQLKPDEPCPLCGSLEHPYAQETPIFNVKEELLKENERLLETKTHLHLSLIEKTRYQTESIQRTRKQIEETRREQEKIAKTLKDIGIQLNWDITEEIGQLHQRRLQMVEKAKALEKCKGAFRAWDLHQSSSRILIQWQDAQKEFIQIKDNRKKIYLGEDIDKETNALIREITGGMAFLFSIRGQLEETQGKLKLVEEDFEKTSAHLQEVIKKEGLDNLDSLRQMILSADEAASFRNTDQKLREGEARLAEMEKNLTSELTKLKALDPMEISDKVLEEEYAKRRVELSELSVKIGAISETLKNDRHTRERQEKILAELQLLKKDESLWKTMNDLIGDATGNKFSNFVQDLTLEQLIGFANKRLTEFSDRYILDIPTADEADRSDTLKIFDKYMGNARRSVRTLSGGETFLVSLAMAFALSDIASRNVKIESLFIDEGFGTLDPETLDQAISILEKMQHEGDRSVGIISHVSALKERITTQVRLEKTSLGYSTIEIVQ